MTCALEHNLVVTSALEHNLVVMYALEYNLVVTCALEHNFFVLNAPINPAITERYKVHPRLMFSSKFSLVQSNRLTNFLSVL